MINTMGPLMDSWDSLLSSELSVPVSKEDAQEDVGNTYVVIRAESETGANNKHSFADTAIIIVDIVSRFKNNVNRQIVENIDSEINAALFNGPYDHNLPAQSGMQILNVFRENTQYINEDNGSVRYYRKISRYSHRLHQTGEAES